MHLIIASEITVCELNIDQANKSQKLLCGKYFDLDLENRMTKMSLIGP